MTDETKAIVAALDRLTAAVTSAFGAPAEFVAEPMVTGCQHPEDRRKSFATSADDDFFCLDCQTMVQQPHAMKGL